MDRDIGLSARHRYRRTDNENVPKAHSDTYSINICSIWAGPQK